MERKPEIDDRVFFTYGAAGGDKTGKVIAQRKTKWGIFWEVQMDEEPSRVDTIERYTGTAEDRGEYCVLRQQNGIGAYLITETKFEVHDALLGMLDWHLTREDAEGQRNGILATRRRCPGCTHDPACQFEPEVDPADITIVEVELL